MALAEPPEHSHAGATHRLERPQEQHIAVRTKPHDDGGLAALGSEHVPGESLRPIEGLRAGAGSLGLQPFPDRLDALQIAGDAQLDRAEARLDGDRSVSFDLLAGLLRFGAEKDSGRHAQNSTLEISAAPRPRYPNLAAIVLQGNAATIAAWLARCQSEVNA